MQRASLLYPFLDEARVNQCSGLIGDEKIKVVGIIGNSPSGLLAKSKFANQVCRRNVFLSPTERFFSSSNWSGGGNDDRGFDWNSVSLDSSGRFSKQFSQAVKDRGSKVISQAFAACMQETKEFDSELSCYIDFFVDEMTSTVFLQLVSFYDLDWLCTVLERELSCLLDNDVHDWLEAQNFHFCKSLLFLFLTTDILLCYSPSVTLDWAYLRMFTTLGLVKNNLQDHFFDDGETFQMLTSGAPQLLFVFGMRSAVCFEKSKKEGEYDAESRGSSFASTKGGASKLKRLQKALEVQVRKLLKTCRVGDDNSGYSRLFCLDSAQLCHIYNIDDISAADRKGSCSTQDPVRSLIFNLSFFENTNMSKGNVSSFRNDSLGSLREYIFEDMSYKTFSSVRGNIGEQKSLRQLAISERSSCLSFEAWIEKCRIVSDSLDQRVGIEDDGGDSVAQSLLEPFLDADSQYSSYLCERMLPMAVDIYRGDLLPCYNRSLHQEQLNRAVSYFLTNTRGPSCSRYKEKLKQMCTEIWEDGRQLCESLSLTGRNCLYAKHKLPAAFLKLFETVPIEQYADIDEKLEAGLQLEDDGLEFKVHESSFRSLQGCNCGRTRKIREDPFHVKEANFLFFEDVSCCKDLPALQFPITSAEFVPETPGRMQLDMPVKFDIHFRSKQDRPKFPSWSLLKVGDASVYNPSLGLEPHEGFVKGSNYLLPWEFPLQVENRKSRRTSVTGGEKIQIKRSEGEMFWKGNSNLDTPPFACLDECMSLSYEYENSAGDCIDVVASRLAQGQKRANVKKHYAAENCKTFVCYVGYEYECPQGHRFLASSPDRITKVSQNSVVKDVAVKLIACDMPIFKACQCSSNVQKYAQLMRIYIVTPPSPAAMMLDPSVLFSDMVYPFYSSEEVRKQAVYSDHTGNVGKQDVAGSKHLDEIPKSYIFTPGICEHGSGIKLPPSSFLVMRLPYVYSYQGRALVYSSSMTNHLSAKCSLIKDAISLQLPKDKVPRNFKF
eukprot:Nk52_evm6s349 gene=Nk52_evmTU6s349